VLTPVLATLVAQGKGIEWAGVVGMVAGGSLVTALGFIAGLTGVRWWHRLVTTVAGATLAVVGTEWAGWLDLDWRWVPVAILAAVCSSQARVVLTPVAARKALATDPWW
jgi:hypothetical protein